MTPNAHTYIGNLLGATMEEDTRKKLSDAAKASYKNNTNFKNQKHSKVCVGCRTDFIGKTINSKLCTNCKTTGKPFTCKFCGALDRSKYAETYCSTCMQTKTYLRGKPRSEEVKRKAREGYEKWKHTEEAKQTFAKIGKQNSEKLKKWFSTPEGQTQLQSVAKKQSILMKQKILEGSFTPNVTNSFTHWTAEIEYDSIVKKFRSSWEACVWLSNPKLEYETIRIPLPNGSSVIVDFVDTENRLIYEIKPKSFWRKQQHKIDAIIDYCLNNDYKFIWINEENILDYVNQTVFVSEFNKKQLEAMLNGTKANRN